MSPYLIALSLTLAIEVGLFGVIALTALHAGSPNEVRRQPEWFSLLMLWIGANLVSHPLATWLWANTGSPFLVVESLVILFEAGVLAVAGFGFRQSLLTSLFINGVSAAIGVWLFF